MRNPMSAEQAHATLTGYGHQQMENYRMAGLPPEYCPRCGHLTMRSSLLLNPLSRHVEAHICPDCGIDEAIRDFAGTTLPLNKWALACPEEGGEEG